MNTSIKGRRVKIQRIDKVAVQEQIKQNKEILERQTLNLPGVGIVVKADTPQDQAFTSSQSKNKLTIPETIEVDGTTYKVYQQ